MNILAILTFVAAIWALYLTVLYRNASTQQQVYRNMLDSWTGAQPTASNIALHGLAYTRFSVRHYKQVPHAFRVLRVHVAFFRSIVVIVCIAFLAFLALVVYAAVLTWNAFGSTPPGIAFAGARVLLTSHILLILVNAGMLPFFRYFEGQYANHHIIIDDQGRRVPV